eukprot:SAG31_NODE_45_length_31062_cov_17.179957_3_plen_579_part_00
MTGRNGSPSWQSCIFEVDAPESNTYWLFDRLTGTAYEAYCDMETVGGGWTLAAVISNTDGQDHFGQNSWFSITDCELQGLRAPTPVWTSGEPFGDTVLTPETTVNSKSAAYFSVAADSIMIREVQGSQRAMRAYSLDSSFGGGEMRTLESLFRSTPDHNEFTNRATCSELVGSSWQTSAFVQFEEIDFNYQLTNDGAVLTPGAAVEQASAGLACRVDGTCNFGYDGNVCQGGSERHYNQGAVDELHTVWLYVRPRSMTEPCPDTALCAGLNRASTCRRSCSLDSGLCGECLPGYVGAAGEGMDQCSLPTYGDGSSAEQAARDCESLGGDSQSHPSGIYWLFDPMRGGRSFQAYCDMETLGGGWTLAAVISNTAGQDHFGTNSWFSIFDCELQGPDANSGRATGAPTALWTSGEPFGDTVLTPLTTANSKSAAYYSVSGNSIMIREVQGHEQAVRAYELNNDELDDVSLPVSLQSIFTSTADHVEFKNRATCSDIVGRSWETSAFMQSDQIDFNYLLNDDGAVIASSAAVQQASAGVACRVDGQCLYGYDGNVCQGGPRHYSGTAVDAAHTLWLCELLP